MFRLLYDLQFDLFHLLTTVSSHFLFYALWSVVLLELLSSLGTATYLYISSPRLLLLSFLISFNIQSISLRSSRHSIRIAIFLFNDFQLSSFQITIQNVHGLADTVINIE